MRRQVTREAQMAERDDDAPTMTRHAERPLRWGEDAVYLGAAFLLIVGAVALLVEGATVLITTIPEGPTDAAKALLDPLLLVFILVELLSAVRSTLHERKLIAEPFLIVGMIATIKEIIVVAISLKDYATKDPAMFEDALLEIATLAGLLIALAIASFLTRLKEREPEE